MIQAPHPTCLDGLIFYTQPLVKGHFTMNTVPLNARILSVSQGRTEAGSSHSMSAAATQATLVVAAGRGRRVVGQPAGGVSPSTWSARSTPRLRRLTDAPLGSGGNEW